MKTLVSLILGGALLAQAAAAHAYGLLPFPSIRKQIYAEAKAEGVLKGMRRPSLRVQINGNTATAGLYALGRSWPSMQTVRRLQKSATFKVEHLIDGPLATPTKSGGQVWHQMFYLQSAKK